MVFAKKDTSRISTMRPRMNTRPSWRTNPSSPVTISFRLKLNVARVLISSFTYPEQIERVFVNTTRPTCPGVFTSDSESKLSILKCLCEFTPMHATSMNGSPFFASLAILMSPDSSASRFARKNSTGCSVAYTHTSAKPYPTRKLDFFKPYR